MNRKDRIVQIYSTYSLRFENVIILNERDAFGVTMNKNTINGLLSRRHLN